VKRMAVASVCPYWSPVMPDKYEIKQFENAEKKKYEGINGINYIFYQRKCGCKFYEQFHSYIDSDVIVFNSLKYKLESSLGRKPKTEVEIIDECDEFLDSFANQRNLNVDRFQNALVHLFSEKAAVGAIVRDLAEISKQIKKHPRINDAVMSQEIIPLKETGIYDLFMALLKSPELLDDADDESYIVDVEETARMFDEFFNESYVSFSKREGNLIASIVTTNLAKKFKDMVDKNKRVVLMSGTIHSENVLKNIFGIDNFKIIEAETEQQGRIRIQRTGLEKDCKYSNFSSNKFTREGYLQSLSKCVEVAKKPLLVHVNSFADLPSKEEISKFGTTNLISRERIKELQNEDKEGLIVDKFKQGKFDVLFSTRCARGIDFPGEECNSIIFTKYPNPNVQDAFWKILSKTQPNYYWDFYKDKAQRELWQKVYRGLRFKEDHVFLLSPDSRVLDAFETFSGEMK